MTIEERIQKAKEAFTERFAGKDPYSLAMIAAAQRANPYSPDTNHDDIRKEWASQLRIITSKYVIPQDVDTFISDVLALRQHMNAMFPGRFNSGKPGYSDGFKVAHAQKSLSVCLKHLWRERNYSVTPPVCPVDGIMLKHVNNGDAWTKVDSIEDPAEGIMGYRSHLALMEEAAEKEGFASVAEWELVVWWESTTGKLTSENKQSSKKEYRRPAQKPGISLPGRIVLKHTEITINGHNLILFIGKNGRGLQGKKLGYYCELIATGKNKDIRKVLGADKLKTLSSLLPNIPPKVKYYIFNNDVTSLDGAEELYNKVKSILSR